MGGYNHGAGGRPPHERNEAIAVRVKMISGMLGATANEIGMIVGLSGPTILKYYRHEYEVGTLEASANVAQSLYRAATNKEKPNVIAAIFFLKCRAGWREDGEGPGKKETADILARVAERDTSWDGLLSSPAAPRLGHDEESDDEPVDAKAPKQRARK